MPKIAKGSKTKKAHKEKPLKKKVTIDQIVHAIPQAIIIVNKKYKITLFNLAAEKLFEIGSKDATGMDAHDLLELYSDNNIPISPEAYCFKKSVKKSLLEDVTLMAKAKKHRVKITTSVLDLADNDDECLITINDITKVKELEKTKDEFLSVASHELRTPMTIIKSYLWMISTERHGKLDPKQKEYIKKAILSTERMIELINDILNVSRIEQNALNVQINRVELVELINELVSDFKVKADEKGLKLHITQEKNKMYAYLDTSKLREILVNLVGNSLKFTDQGEIRIDIRQAGDFQKVSIIDTGRGIKQTELERLFHKFGRLDSSYQTVAESEGTGLGLYIVKLFVDAMGGKIGVFSDGVGKGSTFWFTVPRKKIVKSNGETEKKN
jgi:signal transduction histidine kinase